MQQRFFRECPSATAAELACLVGLLTEDPSAQAQAWLREGHVFSLNDGPVARVSLFQLKDGQPRPVIAEILSTLGKKFTPWEIALWFTKPHVDLEDWKRPVDLLDKEPEAVVEAAKSTTEEVVY
ncbi:MAG TPA: hypothetical protein VIL69_04525 [Roseomonas sp.]